MKFHILLSRTTNAWWNLIVDGVYTGKHATEELRAITGDNSAVLKGDRQHFWRMD